MDSIRWWLSLAAMVVLGACGGSASPTQPAAVPYMSGRITAVIAFTSTSGSIRVEANPLSNNLGLKAVAVVDGLTEVLLPDGKSGNFRSFTTGQWVTLWFDGAIAQSYPVQGTAAKVVIDSVSVTPIGG